MSTKDQVAPLRLQSCLDRLGVEPTELLEIAKNRNVFHVLLSCPPTLLLGNAGMKMNKWPNHVFVLLVTEFEKASVRNSQPQMAILENNDGINHKIMQNSCKFWSLINLEILPIRYFL